MKSGPQTTIQRILSRRGRRLFPAVRGFTLIELLVVVAIIALLLAILLPSLRNARMQTRRLKCQANLHVLMHGWYAYLHDSKEKFPRATNMDINYGGLQGNGSVAFGKNPAMPVCKPLNKQLKMDLVTRSGGEFYHCPSDDGADGVTPTCFESRGSSYRTNIIIVGAMNIYVSPSHPCKYALDQVNKRMGTLKASSLWSPSKLLFMGDFDWVKTWDAAYSYGREWHGQRGQYKYNMAFFDGHVEYIKIRKGIYVDLDGKYIVIPFKDLQKELAEKQQEK